MPAHFLENLASIKATNTERAVALIWHAGLQDKTQDISVKEIASIFEAAGYPKQNSNRLKAAISKDKRTTKTKNDHYRINVKSRIKMDKVYLPYAEFIPVKKSSSVVPLDLYTGTRVYIEKIVLQLNSSFDQGLYDCTAVMCRRLLETLIIEVYEASKKSDMLEGSDGNFFMFSGLKNIIENDPEIELSRNTKQGLNDFKKLGDLSAHSRRFNARRNDIDRVRDGIRVAGEELLHLAKLI